MIKHTSKNFLCFYNVHVYYLFSFEMHYSELQKHLQSVEKISLNKSRELDIVKRKETPDATSTDKAEILKEG